MSINTSKRIILGSGSKSRLDIIEAEGFKVEVITADIDERSIGCRKDASAADNLVTSIAIAKADAILAFLRNNCRARDRGVSILYHIYMIPTPVIASYI